MIKFRIPIYPKTLNPLTLFIKHTHFLSSNPKPSQPSVAIFWDLQNRPPNSVTPFEAAARLKTAASSFGVVRHMIAYATPHAFTFVPQVVGKIRRERNRVVIRDEPNICRVCGRRFYTKEKLVNHFKVHEREHLKRLSQVESARGSRRVKLVGKYAMKMEKYRNAVRDVMIPKQGNGLVSELKRAGFRVKSGGVVALRDDIVGMMEEGRFECLVIVSDDSDFAEVMMEARRRCVRTVAVGDGVLKRAADSGFLWREVLVGKVKKEAVKVVGKWKDRDVLKRLEWKYMPDEDRRVHFLDDEVEDEEIGSVVGGVKENHLWNDGNRKWWELEPEPDADAVS